MVVRARHHLTFLELLLVIGILALLVAIVIVALNPVKQLGDIRDEQRRHNVRVIMDALYRYAVDHDGAFPADIGKEPIEICLGSGKECKGMADLSRLVPTYLEEIPTDPLAPASEFGTDYMIALEGKTITVTAPNTEALGEVIEETR